MAIDMREASELASLLPDEMCCDNAKERLLCIVELLRALTDERHPLSNAEIRAVLRARFGDSCAPSENTIASDLRAIAEAGCLGVVLHTETTGVWLERTDFSIAEVRLLLNAVQSSRILTFEQSAGLQLDILGLVSRHQEEDLDGQIIVGERKGRKSQKVLDVLDEATRAMRLGRKLEFSYTYSGFDGKAHGLKGDDGQRLRRETVIALYFMGDAYYVETYASTPWRYGCNMMKSRADRMAEVRVSDEPEDLNDEVRRARKYARSRIKEGHEMFDGRMRTVFLRVRADMTNTFYDRFGFGYGGKFFELQGKQGDPESSRLTAVRVPETFAFFRWLSASGDRIVMEEPPVDMVLSTMRMKLKAQLKDKSRDELMGDYRVMVRGYLGFLDRARGPYADLDV